MHICKVDVRGYRCIANLTMHCNPGLNVIVGENNAGKSNLFNALRLPFQRRYGFQDVPLTESDFHRGQAGRRDTDEIAVDIEFDGLSEWDKGVFHACIPAGSEKAQMHFRARLVSMDGASRVSTVLYSGDGESASFDYDLLQEFEVVLLGALRNVTPELEPGRRSLVSRRLQKFATDDTKAKLQRLFVIATKFTQDVDYLEYVKNSVQSQLDSIEGAGPLRTRVDLLLGDPEFRQVASTLRFLLRDPDGGGRWEVEDVGLGYANVLYIAAVLSEMQEACTRRHLSFPLLLIEEPEAHLHPQLLQRLAAYLSFTAVRHATSSTAGGVVEAEDGEDPATPTSGSATIRTTQVFVTTHSPILAAGTRLDSMHVLQVSGEGTRSVFSFAKSTLEDSEKSTLERYLDATKSQLLFAHGIILVEGISEALLIPKLAQSIGKPLRDYEVTVVNVGGCSFAPFAKLFGEGALDRPCAVVTDSDPSGVSEGSFSFAEQVREPKRSSRASRCLELEALPHVGVFTSKVTLEFDLALAGLAEPMARIIQDSYSRPSDDLPSLVASESDGVAKAALVYQRILHQTVITKAEIAQQLAHVMDTIPPPDSVVPDYIREAIEHVCRDRPRTSDVTNS